MLTCVQGAATIRESAPWPTEIPTTGAMIIAAANAPAHAARSTRFLTIAIIFNGPLLDPLIGRNPDFSFRGTNFHWGNLCISATQCSARPAGGRRRIGGFWQSSQHVPSRAESLVRVERSGVGVGGGRWYGPACPRVKGAARPCGTLRDLCGTGLRPALDPRDPPALGQGVAGRAMALPASSARRLMSRGVVPDQRGEPTRRTGGPSPRWVCGSRGVFGAGR